MADIRADQVSKPNGTSPIDLIGQSAAKMWINFNGSGVVSIRDSFNVSSLTDNNSGDYTPSFTNNMSDANYAPMLSNHEWNRYVDGLAVGSVDFHSANSSYALLDTAEVFGSVQGDLA